MKCKASVFITLSSQIIYLDLNKILGCIPYKSLKHKSKHKVNKGLVLHTIRNQQIFNLLDPQKPSLQLITQSPNPTFG